MNIHQIAERLNEKSSKEGFKIAELPELRKKYLGKKTLPSKIFSKLTIHEKYAFHHGGRDEIQFNFGEELIDGKQCTRYGLCFSLEPSQSLAQPVQVLETYKQSFNEFIKIHSHLFKDFEMWYYQKDMKTKIEVRSKNFHPQLISDSWFQLGNFITLGNIINKPLTVLNDNDLKDILKGFDKLLPIYEYCVLQNHPIKSKIKIFTRLTSNENNWELPSPHKWRKEDQGKNNIPYENQYGFGHEEWLFNPRYNIGGYQYGYIRGLDKNTKDDVKYDEIHFYTIKKENNKNLVYYLGYIKNVYGIRNNEKEHNIIKEIIENYNNEKINEVEKINGDINGITSSPFEATAKFKIEDKLFFDEPIFQPAFDLGRYKRFQPYKLSNSIEDIFDVPKELDDLGFISGKASQTDIYNRKTKESTVTIEKLHSEIVESMQEFFSPIYNLMEKNISIEIMRFNGNIADIVTQEKDSSISIYEVKTSSSGRRNIRDAIAQLLDYALHTKLLVNKLIIVSPSSLNITEIAFLAGLREKISFPIEYMCYQKESTTKFIKQ